MGMNLSPIPQVSNDSALQYCHCKGETYIFANNMSQINSIVTGRTKNIVYWSISGPSRWFWKIKNLTFVRQFQTYMID